jgi:hypothetical protein
VMLRRASAEKRETRDHKQKPTRRHCSPQLTPIFSYVYRLSRSLTKAGGRLTRRAPRLRAARPSVRQDSRTRARQFPARSSRLFPNHANHTKTR